MTKLHNYSSLILPKKIKNKMKRARRNFMLNAWFGEERMDRKNLFYNKWLIFTLEFSLVTKTLKGKYHYVISIKGIGPIDNNHIYYINVLTSKPDIKEDTYLENVKYTWITFLKIHTTLKDLLHKKKLINKKNAFNESINFLKERFPEYFL